jgi:hypothetical protein
MTRRTTLARKASKPNNEDSKPTEMVVAGVEDTLSTQALDLLDENDIIPEGLNSEEAVSYSMARIRSLYKLTRQTNLFSYWRLGKLLRQMTDRYSDKLFSDLCRAVNLEFGSNPEEGLSQATMSRCRQFYDYFPAVWVKKFSTVRHIAWSHLISLSQEIGRSRILSSPDGKQKLEAILAEAWPSVEDNGERINDAVVHRLPVPPGLLEAQSAEGKAVDQRSNNQETEQQDVRTANIVGVDEEDVEDVGDSQGRQRSDSPVLPDQAVADSTFSNPLTALGRIDSYIQMTIEMAPEVLLSVEALKTMPDEHKKPATKKLSELVVQLETLISSANALVASIKTGLARK